MSIPVAFVDRRVSDEILELAEVAAMPRMGEQVRFREGQAKGKWRVDGVQNLPDGIEFKAVVELRKIQ